jgi:hypothetical protein
VVVRAGEPSAALAGAEHLDLEDLILAYMTRAANDTITSLPPKTLETQR